MNIFYCIEDEISRAVAERLINICCPAGTSKQELGKVYGGSGHIKKNLQKFHNLAQTQPVFIITDLDQAECAPSLRKQWLDAEKIPEPLPERMLFCVVQTEIESWLLADRDGISSFLGVSPARLASNIEMSILDSKEYLVSLAQRSSVADIRKDLAPARRNNASTGINYNYRLSQFAENQWNPRAAAENSLSLHRAINKLSSLMP